MRTSDYRKIESSELLPVLLSVCNGPDFNPGRKALRAQLVEALPDAPTEVIDALMTKCEGYAQKAVDPEARFDLRAGARELCLHALNELEAADRLVPEPEEKVTELEWGAGPSDALKSVEDFDPTQRNLRAIESRLIDRGMGGQA